MRGEALSPGGELEVFLWSSVRNWCRFRQICPELAVGFWERQLLPCTMVTWKIEVGCWYGRWVRMYPSQYCAWVCSGKKVSLV